jgi:hypothetical protein
VKPSATGSGATTPSAPAGSGATTPPAPAGSGAKPPQSDAKPTATAVVVFDSTPQGAEVYGPDKKLLGKTPVNVNLPISDMPLEFELRLTGYRKKTKQLVVSANTMVQVPLERLPAPAGSSGSSSKGSGKQSHSDTALERPD